MLSGFGHDSPVAFNSKESVLPGIWMQQDGKEMDITGNLFYSGRDIKNFKRGSLVGT